MKYLCRLLLILIIILFCLEFIIHFFDSGHSIKYSVRNFKVKEVLTVDGVYDRDNYYFELKGEKFNINFQINKSFNKAEKIIKEIKYFDGGNVKCVLPIFKGNKILTDIMCLKDGVINYYHDMNDAGVDSFAKKIDGYNKNNFMDNTSRKKLSSTLGIFSGNFNDSHYVAMETYKGVKLLNHLEDVKIFEDDIYKKPISIFADKYYIVADYKEEYSFKNIYVVNIINGNMKEIRSYNEISFDSVIQGYVDGKLYIFDKDARVQYEIDIDDESVNKITNEIKYYNGKWGTMTLSEALEGKKFENYYGGHIGGYDKVDKIGSKSGYYYFYKKTGDNYSVYRADIQNKKLLTFLFKTDDLNSVIYLDDYIYFKNGNTFYYYCENGVRKLIVNDELEFNSDISFGVYFE